MSDYDDDDDDHNSSVSSSTDSINDINEDAPNDDSNSDNSSYVARKNGVLWDEHSEFDEDIETYFNSLPDDTTSIDLSLYDYDFTYIPDLSRFTKLEEFICDDREITCLPELPETLTRLQCSQNNITVLPTLPKCLVTLFCAYNKLTCLPQLPHTLMYLHCQHNQLARLPALPNTLKVLQCVNNPIMFFPEIPAGLRLLLFTQNQMNEVVSVNGEVYAEDGMASVVKNINTLYQFRYLFYLIKYRKRFHAWLEPIIRKKYHPARLMEKLLDDGVDLEDVLDNWE